MEGEDEDMGGRDESFEMGEMRMRMGGLGVVDENDGEMMVDAEVELAPMDTMVESDGEVEYMPPKVVGELSATKSPDTRANPLRSTAG
jgi:hypothetical protein